MVKLPHLYKKLADVAKEYQDFNASYEMSRNEIVEKLASTLRFTKKDIQVALKEMGKKKKIKRVNQRKIKLL